MLTHPQQSKGGGRSVQQLNTSPLGTGKDSHVENHLILPSKGGNVHALQPESSAPWHMP